MNFNKIYALGLRHLYLIMNSFPRVLDLIYWPTVQIFLWGFISKFFTLNSEYYNNTVGVILSAAILYDFLYFLDPIVSLLLSILLMLKTKASFESLIFIKPGAATSIFSK